ncbi:MAG: 16S rRNA (guanine(527)-N(7))-methyltransferase RsmG [Bacteroidota bacterium]
MSNQLDLSILLKEITLSITDYQLNRVIEYIRILLEANQTTNLTAITDFNEALVKHIYDSLLIMTLPEFESASNFIDVGSGGGLPSIPLAICNPQKKVVSLEATQKKINFQIAAARQLQLTNLFPIWGRAEETAKQSDHREQYDLAIARAVAPLNILAELALPFIKIHGFAIFYKGKEGENEIVKGELAVKTLGAEISGVKSFTLPCNYGSRVLIIYRKTQPTPSAYPRKPGVPQKKPL